MPFLPHSNKSGFIFKDKRAMTTELKLAPDAKVSEGTKETGLFHKRLTETSSHPDNQ